MLTFFFEKKENRQILLRWDCASGKIFCRSLLYFQFLLFLEKKSGRTTTVRSFFLALIKKNLCWDGKWAFFGANSLWRQREKNYWVAIFPLPPSFRKKHISAIKNVFCFIHRNDKRRESVQRFFARCVIRHTQKTLSSSIHKNIYESLRERESDRVMWHARLEKQNNNKQSSSLLCCVFRRSFSFDFNQIVINIKFSLAPGRLMLQTLKITWQKKCFARESRESFVHSPVENFAIKLENMFTNKSTFSCERLTSSSEG